MASQIQFFFDPDHFSNRLWSSSWNSYLLQEAQVSNLFKKPCLELNYTEMGEKQKQQLLIWRKREFRDQSFKIEICICFLLFSCLCSFLAEEEEEEVDKCDLAQFESFPAAMFSSVYFEDNRDNQTFLPKHLHGQLFKQ